MITNADFDIDNEDEWSTAATCAAHPPVHEPGVYGHPVIEDEIPGAYVGRPWPPRSPEQEADNTWPAPVFDDGEPARVFIHVGQRGVL